MAKISYSKVTKVRELKERNLLRKPTYKPFSVYMLSFNMVEFNHDIWNNWILEGYLFVIYKEIDARIIVKPVREMIPDEMITNFDALLYRIGQDEIFLLAENNGALKVYCEDINPD